MRLHYYASGTSLKNHFQPKLEHKANLDKDHSLALVSLLLQLWRARAVLKPALLDELGKQREQAL